MKELLNGQLQVSAEELVNFTKVSYTHEIMGIVTGVARQLAAKKLKLEGLSVKESKTQSLSATPTLEMISLACELNNRGFNPLEIRAGVLKFAVKAAE